MAEKREVFLKRRQKLNRELVRIVSLLKKKYKPEKIILYGSFAHGRVYEWSDLDLVVVKKTKKRFYDRIGEASGLFDHREAVDLLVYTPEEFADMLKWSPFIKYEVLKKGRILYENA